MRSVLLQLPQGHADFYLGEVAEQACKIGNLIINRRNIKFLPQILL